jgi:uncharacterized protein (DUF1330 family)
MSAYVISEVEAKDDAAGLETYRTMAAKTIAQFGGRYLVHGGGAGVVEGGPLPKREHHHRRSRRWSACANGTPRRNTLRR